MDARIVEQGQEAADEEATFLPQDLEICRRKISQASEEQSQSDSPSPVEEASPRVATGNRKLSSFSFSPPSPLPPIPVSPYFPFEPTGNLERKGNISQDRVVVTGTPGQRPLFPAELLSSQLELQFSLQGSPRKAPSFGQKQRSFSPFSPLTSVENSPRMTPERPIPGTAPLKQGEREGGGSWASVLAILRESSPSASEKSFVLTPVSTPAPPPPPAPIETLERVSPRAMLSEMLLKKGGSHMRAPSAPLPKIPKSSDRSKRKSLTPRPPWQFPQVNAEDSLEKQGEGHTQQGDASSSQSNLVLGSKYTES